MVRLPGSDKDQSVMGIQSVLEIDSKNLSNYGGGNKWRVLPEWIYQMIRE
jgi:hypothetical protein